MYDEKERFIDVRSKWKCARYTSLCKQKHKQIFSYKEFPSCYRGLSPGHVDVPFIPLGNPAC